jgi:eukaryotic-like serine/threonine-protein kinase
VTEDDAAPTQQETVARPTVTNPTGSTFDHARYDLGPQLGRGGMGEVRLARDVRIDRDVAVKLMRPEQRDAVSTARFFREARIQGRLDHPAIPPVYDLGSDADGNPYFVMKRLTGTTLFDVLAGRANDAAMAHKWSRRQLLTTLVDVCLAVEFAHTRDIVHRDLKPANIMLGEFGEVYVLDWGLARVIDSVSMEMPITPFTVEGEPTETHAGAVLGTPGYMPPEQIRSDAVDSRADVYALGCILYELVTDQQALPRGLAGMTATLEIECHRPSVRFPGQVAPELDDLCARATAAVSSERPSARDLADGVQAYLDGDRDLARRRELAAVHATTAAHSAAEPGDDNRASAIREAGRALALDANNAEAQAVLGRLLLDAPGEHPAAALAAAERERGLTRQIVLRSISRGYVGVTVLFAGTFFFPVHHPAVIAAALLLCTLTAVWAYLTGRAPVEVRSKSIGIMFWLNACTMCVASIVYGPLLGIPVFVIGSVAAVVSQPTGYPWPVAVGSQVLGLVVPLTLEWLGVLPSTYHVSGGTMVFTPWVLDLTPGLGITLFLVAVGSQVALTAGTLVVRGRTQQDAEDRLYAVRWHLEQLLPKRAASVKRLAAAGEIRSATGHERAKPVAVVRPND